LRQEGPLARPKAFARDRVGCQRLGRMLASTAQFVSGGGRIDPL